MPVLNSIAANNPEMTDWRRDFHTHPEIAYEEQRTAAIVAEKLESWGLEVHRGIAKTGIVGVLKVGEGTGTLGLRADMDALPMQEQNDFAHKSTNPEAFHGCGHDGHTTMLLGAARYLAETQQFDGTVHFIFQPAEEGEGGGERMVEEGLFERFPCDEVYALHNWPTMPAGQIGMRAGPVMAAADKFTIEIEGKGGHAAYPHATVDPVIIAAQLITAFQTLVSRSTSPLDCAVISTTTVEAGTAFNVIPGTVRLGGTVRTFKPEIQRAIHEGMARMTDQICAAFGARGELNYLDGYPATINHPTETEYAAEAACDVVGVENVITDVEPSMGGEDFAYMLERRPGCYFFVGQGGGPSDSMLHHPTYEFNDDILPIGASMFARLVERRLARPEG
ncbi:MAG: M20 aminoacylase family protein [Pseudomonadota bacterium]